MKERLIQLLDLEQLSPSKFADIIGVQRSSISHVLSGRNKPSFDFLQKTLKAFPGLNASWLMTGEGSMYEQMGRKVPGNLFDTPAEAEERSDVHIPEASDPPPEEKSSHEGIQVEATTEPAAAESNREQAEAPAAALTPDKKRIVQVMVIYEDDTFKTFTPAN